MQPYSGWRPRGKLVWELDSRKSQTFLEMRASGLCFRRHLSIRGCESDLRSRPAQIQHPRGLHRERQYREKSASNRLRQLQKPSCCRECQKRQQLASQTPSVSDRIAERYSLDNRGPSHGRPRWDGWRKMPAFWRLETGKVLLPLEIRFVRSGKRAYNYICNSLS